MPIILIPILGWASGNQAQRFNPAKSSITLGLVAADVQLCHAAAPFGNVKEASSCLQGHFVPMTLIRVGVSIYARQRLNSLPEEGPSLLI
jgi:hypothetical protein